MENIIKFGEVKPSATIQFYRVNQLVEMLCISKSTLWLWVSKGIFPKPYKLGENVTAWRADDIQDWVDTREKSNT